MRTLLVIAATLAALAIGAGLFIESGYYDIGADDHHTALTLTVIEQLRERSIEVRARSIQAPALEDSAKIAAGARRYASLCSGCHLAPGAMRSEIRAGLYPHPPNLAQADEEPAARAFWIVKHGIKMTGMPAWGRTLDDAAIWEIVAFVRKLPAMTPEAYGELARPEAPGISRGNY